MSGGELELLLGRYAIVHTKEDAFIRRTLEDVEKLLTECDSREYYYADMIVGHFCRVIDVLEKQHQKEQDRKPVLGYQPSVVQYYQNHLDLVRAFYNHFKEPEQVDYLYIADALEAGRKDLVNSTLKDYVAKIYTFSGPKYLGQMFGPQEIDWVDPVLFTYENLEQILATFQTRGENGEIIKQRVNIRSALRKLNEFKQQAQCNGNR